jgi:hypothetical protein
MRSNEAIYCSRSVFVGLSREARNAGALLPAMLTTRSSAAVAAKVTGSVGRTSNGIPVISRVSILTAMATKRNKTGAALALFARMSELAAHVA